MFWKKHRPRCFWRCSKKAETSCSRCILAMFLLTILNELKNCSKFFEICNKLWQQCVYSNNLLTKILAWQAILYQRGINIVGPNHFWRCGPRPKTSRKTSHFLLNDAMFQRCFEKNIDLDVFDDVWKNPKHRINDASNDGLRPPLSPPPSILETEIFRNYCMWQRQLLLEREKLKSSRILQLSSSAGWNFHWAAIKPKRQCLSSACLELTWQL